MTVKSFVIAMLAGTALVAAPAAFAELIKAHHYYVVDDDDDDDGGEWAERRNRKKGKKDRDPNRYGYYRYERPPGVIYGPPPQIARPQPDSPSSRSFPRESLQEHSAAKNRQRNLLEKELAAEQQLLADAKGRLDEQSAQHHERNIEALRRELRSLQR